MVLATSALVASVSAVAGAAPVRFDTDSFPVLRGRMVHIDFNPSKLAPSPQGAGGPISLAFFFPHGWTFDARAVKHECTAADAAAVNCPREARIGFGHVVAHVSGYLFPGGATDGVAYLTAYLGAPVVAGDRASIVLEVEFLSLEPLIAEVNKYPGTKIPIKSSLTGRLFAVSGRYGLEASFNGFPGGIAVPTPFANAGIRASVTRFKIEVGAVRRVRKPIVHTIPIETLNGPGVERIHDHVLIGYHLFKRPAACPASQMWPWRIDVGFPQGSRRITGNVRCYG